MGIVYAFIPAEASLTAVIDHPQSTFYDFPMKDPSLTLIREDSWLEPYEQAIRQRIDRFISTLAQLTGGTNFFLSSRRFRFMF